MIVIFQQMTSLLQKISIGFEQKLLYNERKELTRG